MNNLSFYIKLMSTTSQGLIYKLYAPAFEIFEQGIKFKNDFYFIFMAALNLRK